jgi:hypothetical protein
VKSKGKSVGERNVEYFQALANSRAAPTQTVLLSLAGGLIGGLDSVGLYYSDGYGKVSLTYVCIVLTALCAGILLVSLPGKLLYRFQVFYAFLLALFVIILTFVIDVLCWMIAVISPVDQGVLPPSVYTGVTGLVAAVTVVGSLVANGVLLRHRLRVGFSQERTNGNFMATSKIHVSKSFWIIFAIVLIVPNSLTQGEYLINIFGWCGVLLFSVVFPSPIVEFSYLAYLKTKDKKYWAYDYK